MSGTIEVVCSFSALVFTILLAVGAYAGNVYALYWSPFLRVYNAFFIVGILGLLLPPACLLGDWCDIGLKGQIFAVIITALTLTVIVFLRHFHMMQTDVNLLQKSLKQDIPTPDKLFE